LYACAYFEANKYDDDDDDDDDDDKPCRWRWRYNPIYNSEILALLLF